MSGNFQFIIPDPPPSASVFEVHQLAYEFRQEVEERQRHQAYCQWYYETAKRHQQELRSMRGDINIFGWFLRGIRR
ncbi:hypothetical protein IQ249_19785 [Lusitaniella coriacea LEGE 07157]|uniref:Uncharacterized protein n=2 Tax=Lusitaniella TaxID=1983104 RepID=A0A8J7E3T4_9CYAN|nr:hypothetical protein [Lusitaniella coriacea LEGE 07157]